MYYYRHVPRSQAEGATRPHIVRGAITYRAGCYPFPQLLF